ncbi:hypothetical protein D9M71_724890 [compost metagenome]
MALAKIENGVRLRCVFYMLVYVCLLYIWLGVRRVICRATHVHRIAIGSIVFFIYERTLRSSYFANTLRASYCDFRKKQTQGKHR